eukprot:6626962-Pyramimonas_sp.AAC.1
MTSMPAAPLRHGPSPPRVTQTSPSRHPPAPLLRAFTQCYTKVARTAPRRSVIQMSRSPVARPPSALHKPHAHLVAGAMSDRTAWKPLGHIFSKSAAEICVTSPRIAFTRLSQCFGGSG